MICVQCLSGLFHFLSTVALKIDDAETIGILFLAWNPFNYRNVWAAGHTPYRMYFHFNRFAATHWTEYDAIFASSHHHESGVHAFGAPIVRFMCASNVKHDTSQTQRSPERANEYSRILPVNVSQKIMALFPWPDDDKGNSSYSSSSDDDDVGATTVADGIDWLAHIVTEKRLVSILVATRRTLSHRCELWVCYIRKYTVWNRTDTNCAESFLPGMEMMEIDDGFLRFHELSNRIDEKSIRLIYRSEFALIDSVLVHF